jgi:hypothetical protein
MEVVLKHVFWSKFKGIYLTNHPLPGDKPFCTVRRLMCWLEILLLIPGELMFISGRISSNNLASSDECLYTVGRTCTSLWPCLLCVSCLPAVGRAHLFIVSSDRKNRASSELDFLTSCHASADDSRGTGSKHNTSELWDFKCRLHWRRVAEEHAATQHQSRRRQRT